MIKHTLNYNLIAILLEKFKTVGYGDVPALKKGNKRNVLDPQAWGGAPGTEAQVSYEDTKIKKGQKGYVKPKQRKDIKQFRDFHADKSVPTGTSYKDWKAGNYDSKLKQAPKTDLSSDYLDNKPDKMTTALVPYKPQLPSTDVKKPAAPKPKAPKIKKPGIGSSPDQLYKAGDSDFTFMTAYDPDRFKKISGALKGAQGVEAGPFEGYCPRLTDILIGD